MLLLLTNCKLSITRTDGFTKTCNERMRCGGGSGGGGVISVRTTYTDGLLTFIVLCVALFTD